MIGELEKLWIKTAVVILEGLKQTTENFGQDSRYPGRDMTSYPEYSPRMFPTHGPGWFRTIWKK
jgi:hypothetical protein